MSEKTAVIGDVHGCIEELEEMLSILTHDKRVDTFVFVGDLLDKGPDSAKVVKRIRRLKNQYKVVLVKGNHEEKHERFRRHLDRETGQEKRMKGYEELSKITETLSEEDISFLEDAVLYHQIPEHNVLVVHAGVSPSIGYLPSHEDLDRMGRKKRKHFEQMLRVRYVNPKGYMVSLGRETEDDVFWAEEYQGVFGTVYFGHQPYYDEEPKKFPHAVGLDLGCVFGNKLCAAILSEEGTEYLMVDAKKQYAEKHFLDKEQDGR